MHQALPYGLHVVGLPLTDKDTAFVSATAKRITNLKKVSGVDSMKMVYDLPDGGSVIVQDVGGNFRVIAHKPLPEESRLSDGIATDFVPMLYSGVITTAIVDSGVGVGLRLTKTTRHRLRQYDVEKTEPAKDISLHRFRIGYDSAFPEFIPKKPSSKLKTQYEQLRPTWYSGAMAEVMQIVGGYGIQDTTLLPDNELERAQLALPLQVVAKIKEEMNTGLRLPGFTGIPDARGRFKYDYKFNKTNSIGFDNEGKPWLLQISSRGVWAMPLPIIPATATVAFRSYIEEMRDEEILKILDRFGAMPSGENFPSGNDFESWRRAGVIIKVCDSSDFYSHIAYSSACGWSINDLGNEGYNTCYNYEDDSGMGYGLTYKLKLNLSATATYKGMPPSVIDSEDARSGIVTKYLASLLPTVGTETSDARATMYKIRRAGFDALYDRARIHNGEQDLNYWRNLELEPIASHKGSITQVYSGYLYHHVVFASQPQFKIPEPLVGGCLSHDFLPINKSNKGALPNSDTIMFAYYIGNSLKTVKYFIDWGQYHRDVEDNFERIMTVGSWRRDESVGLSELQGHFYSSEIDDRDILSPKTVITRIEGRDMGYDSKPFFAFDATYSMSGSLWRRRYYTHESSVTAITGQSLSLAVCIPYFCRNSVIHSKRESFSKKEETTTLSLHSVLDPTSYRYWTYHPIFAWSGGPVVDKPRGSPYPKDGSPVWVEISAYSPFDGSDFADSGEWIPSLPQNYAWLIHPKSDVWNANGGGGAPTVKDYRNTKVNSAGGDSGAVSLSLGPAPDRIHERLPEVGYHRASPDALGNIFYKDATTVVFGNATYRNVSEHKDFARYSFWGSCDVADNKSAHHFIGVINE